MAAVEASMVAVGLAAAAFVGAEVKVSMGVDSAAAASAGVVDMPPVPEVGRSRKALVEGHMPKARGEARPWKAPEDTELLRVPLEVKLPEDPVGLMRKGHMAAVITTEALM
jgi:hypothetical protein